MAMSMPVMDWSFRPLSESLKVFKARMTLYLEDQNINDDTKKATKIKIASGDEGMRRLLNSGMSEEDQRNPIKIWDLLEDEVDHTVKISFRVHRLEFANIRQQPSETTQQYLSKLREKATKCAFEPAELNERLIEMIILSTPHEDFRKELLTKPKGYSITNVIERGREFEAILASQASLKSMHEQPPPQDHKVDAIRRKAADNQKDTIKNCRNCGLTHAPRSCPAYNDTCNACGSKGHWRKQCRKTGGGRRPGSASTPVRQTDPTQQQPPNIKRRGRPHHEIGVAYDEEEYAQYAQTFYSVMISDITSGTMTNDTEAFTTLDTYHENPRVTGTVRLKVDTGAGGNTLPLRTYRQMFGDIGMPDHIVKPERHVKLTSYSGNEIPCLGSLQLGLKKDKHTHFHHEKFFIVDVQGPAIIGLPTCQKLDIVSLHLDSMTQARSPVNQSKEPLTSIENLKAAYPNHFDRIGQFKEPAKLHLKEGAIPSCDAPRKVSIHLKPKIKAELTKMEQDGIIRKVEEHSDWCSSLVYVTKADGSLRICLDPKKLNENLRRCPHKIPTLEEINPTFSKATVFSKLDAKAGYWSVPLHEESQLLTTFRTPFGRYCWKRLPFGLNVSQDIFQARMDQLTEGLEGIANIADDIAVAGKNHEDHDMKLHQLMQKATSYGLCLNSSKCDIAKAEISFFGNTYSRNGLKPDPAKVRDLHNMPSPKSKEDLQRLLGLLTYLSSFIPNFSGRSEPLRNLLKSESIFLWEADHEHTFQTLKQAITQESVLAFYDPSTPLTLEVDSSMKGLGGALLQNKRPIAFASKALTPTQANYSNIEREALALVHGVQRFHTYLYGKRFTALTDHKPLENIWKKPLTSAPPRLQRLFLQLQGYDMDLHYCPGPDMILSDTLSRLPCPNKATNIPLDTRVDGIVHGEKDLDEKPIALLNFTSDRLTRMREQTAQDPELRLLVQLIIGGWPDDIRQCPPEIRHFFSYRESLALEDGIIFKGRQVIIPAASREDILKQLHTSHQGIKKTQLLARESVFWRNINKDIEQMTKQCEVCQKYQPEQSQEPTLHHSIPPTPWWKLGTDMFHINNKNYLIIVDYFSKYPIVSELGTLSSKRVVDTLKTTFALFGVPKELISDNGPQFSGSEFRQFIADWGITHTTSSPYHPKSNGLAERTIQTVKHLIRKCTDTDADISSALLHLRATPIDQMAKSPAELMFGRPMTTMSPSRTEPQPHHVDTRNHLYSRLQTKPGQVLPTLLPGQRVRVLDQPTHTWVPGSIQQKTSEPRSYMVKTDNGQHFRRNRIHIRADTSQRPQHDMTPQTRAEDVGPTTEVGKYTEQQRRPNAAINSAAADPDPALGLQTANSSPQSPQPKAITSRGRKIFAPPRYR